VLTNANTTLKQDTNVIIHVNNLLIHASNVFLHITNMLLKYEIMFGTCLDMLAT